MQLLFANNAMSTLAQAVSSTITLTTCTGTAVSGAPAGQFFALVLRLRRGNGPDPGE